MEVMELQIIHAPKEHFMNAFKALASLHRSGELCDVVLIAGGREFSAHKIVLVACCPYFSAMFRSGMTETKDNRVELKNVDPDALESVLRLFYTGRVTLTSLNIQNLLSISCLFQLESLRDSCAAFVHRQLSPGNCLGIRDFAEMHGCTSLAKAAHLYALKHFEDVQVESEYLLLPVNQVEELISSNKLKVQSEECVFDALISWISHNPSERNQHVTRLLKAIRLPLLDPAVIVDKVLKNPLVHGNLECRDMIDESLVCVHVLPDRKEDLPPLLTQPRLGMSEGGVVYVVGGLGCAENSASSVERFDIDEGVWQISKPMDILRSRVGVAAVRGKLYVFGGYDGTIHRLSAVECYDPQKDKWSSCSPMSTRRSAMGVAVLGEQVYVLGGYDGIHSLNSVEVYNTIKDVWTKAPSLLTSRSAPGSATLNGCVYAVGGHDGLSIFSSVEKYDPELQQWTYVSDMQSKRCRLGVTSADGKLFSIGGFDGHQFLNSVECFDDQSELWSYLPNMKCRRSRVGTVSVGKKLYVIGGYDGGANLSSMEVYDVESGEWTLSQPMAKHYGAVGVAVLL